MGKEMNSMYLFTLFVILFGCGTEGLQSEKEQWLEVRNSDRIVDFVNFAFQYPDSKRIDSCYYHIDNLVKNNNHFQFAIAQAYNTKTKEIRFEFMDTNNDYGEYYVQERNAYVLTVTDSTVFHDDISIDSDMKLIKEEIIGLLKSKTSSDGLPQREKEI